LLSIALVTLSLGSLAREADAQYYWNTTGTGLWSTGANWSNNATSGGTPGTVPITTGTAFFNQSSVNGDTTVELASSGTVRSLQFLNTGSTLIRASASGTQSLRIGNGPIILDAGVGSVTIGDATNMVPVTFAPSGNFTITNNSASTIRFANSATLTAGTLITDGTGTGGVQIDNGLKGYRPLTAQSLGRLTLTGSNELDSFTVSSGTLEFYGNGSLADSATYLGGTPYWGGTWGTLPTITANGALVFSGSAGSSSQAARATLTGTGSFVWDRPAMFTLTGSNGFSGMTTISSGTFVVGARSTSLASSLGRGNYVNNGLIVVNTVNNTTGTYAGSISGTGGLIKTGAFSNSSNYSTLTLTGSNTFTGPLAVQAGTVELNFSGTSSPAANVLSPQTTVAMGVNVGTATPAVSMYGAATGAAGSWLLTRPQLYTYFNVTGSSTGNNSQSLAGLTVNDGIASVTVTAPASSSMALSVGDLKRSSGSRGIVVFYPSATGTASLATPSTNTNGIVGPWAFMSTGSGMHWVTSAASGGTSGALTAFSGYVTNTWASGSNTNVAADATVPAGAVTNSLRVVGPAILTLAGTATVSSGGIILNATGGNTAVAIRGGVLRGSPTDGLLITGGGKDSSWTEISAVIVDNGSATDLAYMRTLNGSTYGLTLAGNNTYTGRTVFNNSLQLGSYETGTSGPLGVGGPIQFMTGGGGLYYGLGINSADYSGRFTNSPNQSYNATVKQYGDVTWAGSFGSDTASLSVGCQGNLTLSGSNTFPIGVTVSAEFIDSRFNRGNVGSVTLGSVNAFGSVGTVSVASYKDYLVKLRYTAASAGLDLGSRIATGFQQTATIDTNGQNVEWATNSTSGLNNSGALNKMGFGQLTLSGSMATGNLIVSGGTLAIDSRNLAAGLTTNAGVYGFGVGTFRLSGAAGAARTQIVNGVALQSGLLTVEVNNPGTSTTLNMAGSGGASVVSRSGTSNYLPGSNGTVDFRAVGGTLGSTVIIRTAASQAVTNGILGPWATVDGAGWATHTSGTILPYSGYTEVAGDSIADGGTTNARIASTGGTVSLAAATTTVNTLLQSATTAATISLSGQTLRTGGVMVGRTAARLVIGDAVGSGTLQPTSSGGEVILTNFGSGSMTVNSVIADNTAASQLTISGTGTVVLTASNTLTGATQVHGGTLQIGDGGTTGAVSSPAVFVAPGATLVFNRSDDYGGPITYRITGTPYGDDYGGGIVVRSGNLTLSGSTYTNGGNLYSGLTQLLGGTVTINQAQALSSAGGIVFGGGVLRYGSVTPDLSGRIAGSTSPIVIDTQGNSVTFAYPIAASNTGGLTKRGTGTLTLNGANAYQGTTTIEAGTLRAAAQAIPGDIINSSTLTLSNDALTVGGVYAGVISGTGAVSVTGTTLAPITLTGSSTYAAVPVASTGRLDIGWTAPAGQASPLGTSGTVNIDAGYLGYSGATPLTFDRTVNLVGTTWSGGLAADGAGAFILTTDFRVSGVGTKTFTLTGSGTAANEMRGVIANYDATRLTNMSKTGPGLWQLTGANTFSGTVSITEGTLSVPTLTNAGINGPLGSGTGNAAGIRIGSMAAPAALRYTGTTSGTTNRGVILTGTGILEAMGSGAATFSTVTGSAGANTLVLGGTSVANNTLGVISDAPSSGVTSVVKNGSGVWRLTVSSSFTGGFTVRQGTVIADVNSGGQGQVGAFGTADAVTVGDATAGALGTAALLLAPDVRVSRQVLVPAATGTGTQTVLLGSTGTSGASGAFEGDAVIQLGRAVTLVAAAGGTANFSNTWSNFDNTGPASVNVSVGSAAYPGTVLVNNNLATQGLVNVRFGRLDVAMGKTVTATGGLSIDSPGTLVGSGVIAATLGGAGLVAPGNSPGILTAQAVDPTGGLDWAFELTGTAPSYGDAAASVNDILRLTGTAAAPFTAGLNSGNVVSLYFATLPSLGEVFQGGFFTDSGTAAFGNFGQLVTSGSFVGYYKQAGGSFTHNGESYALLSTQGRGVEPGVTTVASAGFDAGNTTITGGQVTTFTVVVPEPGSLALAALGLGLAGWALRRRRAL
jgi:autotransporter-associated beta strand protein